MGRVKGRKHGPLKKWEMWLNQKGKCAICRESIPIDDVQNTEKINVDHWYPLGRGGTGKRENLRLTHVECNSDKGDTVPWQVVEDRGV